MRVRKKEVTRAVLNKYHILDCRKLSQTLGGKPLVDVTITSPPYWDLKDYANKNQIGKGQPYKQFLGDLQRIFSSVRSVTKPTGSLWIVADTIKRNGQIIMFPFDLAQGLQAAGWYLQDIIIWSKDKTIPWSHRGKMRNIFEYILFFSKERKFKYFMSRIREIEQLKEWWVRYPERYSPYGKAPTRCWNIAIPRQGNWGKDNVWVRHACPFPPALVARIIELTTDSGDVVLDPFAGSGITLAQAQLMKRRFIGFDVNARYREMYEKRVLPTIKRQVLPDKVDRKSLISGKKQKFRSLIWQLRKLKYPREIYRLLRGFESSILGFLVVDTGKDTQAKLVTIQASQNGANRELLEKIIQITSNPPLSKYELQVDQLVMRPGEFLKGPLLKRLASGKAKLWLYKNGITHWTDESVKPAPKILGGLLDSPIRRYPPILSNIKVRVKPGSGLGK